MPRVTVYDGNVEKALRKFKKKVSNAGILEEVRNRQHYEKPSEKRQRARAAAKARYRKKMREDGLPPKRRI